MELFHYILGNEEKIYLNDAANACVDCLKNKTCLKISGLSIWIFYLCLYRKVIRKEHEKMEITVEVRKIIKIYKNDVKVLNDISYEFEKGKFYAVMGRSGAGKSTLLNIIGTIDNTTEGEVYINGNNISGLTEKEKAKLRMKNLGFVFQGFYLNPYLNALENVIVPMRINPEIPKKERKERAEKLLEKFGVEELANSLPSQMSGGEQQRVCIARALANNPDIILADEPTGNLDEENEKIVFSSLKTLAEQGHTVITVSHNEAVKEFADKVIMLSGKIQEM